METWECGPNDVGREIDLICKRGNDIFPQGKEQIFEMLNNCRKNGRRFRIKASKTFPFWTWYYEVI